MSRVISTLNGVTLMKTLLITDLLSALYPLLGSCFKGSNLSYHKRDKGFNLIYDTIIGIDSR